MAQFVGEELDAVRRQARKAACRSAIAPTSAKRSLNTVDSSEDFVPTSHDQIGNPIVPHR